MYFQYVHVHLQCNHVNIRDNLKVPHLRINSGEIENICFIQNDHLCDHQVHNVLTPLSLRISNLTNKTIFSLKSEIKSKIHFKCLRNTGCRHRDAIMFTTLSLPSATNPTPSLR